MFDNITERKRAEEGREATIELLQLCNKADSSLGLMQQLTLYFQRATGCEAVGVRLREGDDFPYFETRGFPDDFVRAENSLCARDPSGELLRDRVGHPALDCMCGNVLCGRFDPTKPFFTAHGSFWSSGTTELLAATTEAERQAKTRNRCNGEGYESVALIPLRLGDETFGLFQFNDQRKGRFTAERIALFETLVDYVAIALAKLQSDEALREASRFNQQVIRNAEEGVIVHGPDLRFRIWNPFMQRLSGLAAEEVVGKHPAELFPFLRETGVIERLERALMGQSSSSGDFPYQYSQSGRSGWLSDTYAPLRNTKGEIVGVIATVRDVTERVKSEQTLRESEERLSLALAGSRMGVWEWDVRTNALYGSPECSGILGVSGSGGTLQAFADVLHPEDVARVRAAAERALTEKTTYTAEFRVRRPDGEVRWLSALGRWKCSEDGEPLRMVGTVRDVTDRKRSAERIEHLNRVLLAVRTVDQLIVREKDPQRLIEETCRLLVEHRGYSGAVVILTDEGGVPLTFAHSGAEKFFPSLAELLRRKAVPPCCERARRHPGVFHVTDRDDVCASCPLAPWEALGDSACIRLRHDETSYGYLAVTMDRAQQMDAEEGALLSGLADDVAFALHNLEQGKAVARMQGERDRIEAELRQAQKMEAVGRLAGGVAHDFNNLLTVINGLAELVASELSPNDPLLAKMQGIQDAGSRAASLTRQLLAFSRQQVVRPRSLDLNEAVGGLEKMLQRLIGEDIELVCRLGAEVDRVYLDPSQVDQILANLVVNARDAIPGTGTVTVETSAALLDARDCATHPGATPGEYAVLSVRDTGVGMDAETLARIFEPFFTTKEPGKGTGLGLATVYGIVKQAGGSVHVRSEPGQGATFRVYLPRWRGEAATAVLPDAATTTLRGTETVLLVEDEEPILALGRGILARRGYRVLTARTPGEALLLAGKESGEIHLLATDVVMPGMNGRELCERLRGGRPDLRCLYLSGYTADVLTQRGVLPEGVHFLQKPYSLKGLAEKVRVVLDAR